MHSLWILCGTPRWPHTMYVGVQYRAVHVGFVGDCVNGTILASF